MDSHLCYHCRDKFKLTGQLYEDKNDNKLYTVKMAQITFKNCIHNLKCPQGLAVCFKKISLGT